MKKMFLAALCIALFLIILLSCDTRNSVVNENPPDYPSLSFTDAEPAWGTVTNAGSGVTIQFRVRSTDLGDVLEVQLSAAATGFVAVGFNPTTAMRDADFVIGFVKDSQVRVRDDYGTAAFSHAEDTVLGGTADLYNVTGSESGGTTTLGFSKPLGGSDPYDRNLARGTQYRVLFSMSSSDDFSMQHAARGSELITIP